MNNISHNGEKIRVIKPPMIYIFMLEIGTRRNTFTGYLNMMR